MVANLGNFNIKRNIYRRMFLLSDISPLKSGMSDLANLELSSTNYIPSVEIGDNRIFFTSKFFPFAPARIEILKFFKI
jgi:hypothetical protein